MSYILVGIYHKLPQDAPVGHVFFINFACKCLLFKLTESIFKYLYSGSAVRLFSLNITSLIIFRMIRSTLVNWVLTAHDRASVPYSM